MANLLNVGFIGAGKMAAALAKGFIRAELVTPREMRASDPHDAARKNFTAEIGAATTASNADVAKFAGVLILATKPDQVSAALAEIRGAFTKKHLLISIAAGVTLAKLEAALPAGARVIRVMPNTPALVGAGASAFALGKNATAADSEQAKKLLSAVGVALQVKESLLDAVTGLSLPIHRGAKRRRRGVRPAARHCDEARRANGFGRREDGFGNRPASGRAQGPSDQSRRHDN